MICLAMMIGPYDWLANNNLRLFDFLDFLDFGAKSGDAGMYYLWLLRLPRFYDFIPELVVINDIKDNAGLILSRINAFRFLQSER